MRLVLFSGMWVLATSLAAQTMAPRQITEEDKAALRSAVVRELKDPDSARFRWLPDTGSKEIYCGFVNAKNSFGGYAGFVPFEAMLFDVNGKPLAAVVGIGNPDPRASMTLAIIKICSGAGIDMNGPTSE